MANLEKAKLQEVSADENQTPIGSAVAVQFNPNSLQLKLNNQSDGGRTRGRQRRQNNGQSSTVLSMDLIFDSADEGSADAPVSVRTKTREVERFVLPKEDDGEVPPRIQFEWDELIIAGIVEALAIDFDHFAENGAPLRAKMNLTIKEQEPKYTFLQSGKGSKGAGDSSKPGAGNGATNPGGGTNEPGADKSSDRALPALADETPADFLARQGIDPSAWRGLDVDLSAGIGFEAGLEVGFSVGLSVSAGLGLAQGVQANSGVSLASALGMNAVNPGAGDEASGVVNSSGTTGSVANNKKINGDDAGLALSAAGGITAALASVKMHSAEQAVVATQSAFAVTQATIGSASAGARADGEQAQSATLQLPQIDDRAASYGYGVPLRPRYETGLLQTTTTLTSRAGQPLRDDQGPGFALQKNTPPWVALPARNSSRTLADHTEQQKQLSPCDFSKTHCPCEGI